MSHEVETNCQLSRARRKRRMTGRKVACNFHSKRVWTNAVKKLESRTQHFATGEWSLWGGGGADTKCTMCSLGLGLNVLCSSPILSFTVL